MRSEVATDRGKAALRIVLVEDHAVLLEGLRLLLETEADFDIVGVASNALDGIELAQRLTPDIVITDISLGAHSGFHVISELNKLVPAIRVLVLTCSDNPQYIKAALLAGARGYVLKEVCRADLVQAIRAVYSGYYLLHASVSEAFIACYLAKDDVRRPGQLSSLTAREREIVALIAQGASNRRMAAQLKLSVKTIAKHRANAMRKANLRNTAGITTFAICHGLNSPPLEPLGLQ